MELLRRRRINCVYIGGRMFLTARWKSTQCQSYWKSPHQISTIVRFLLVNRIQSTNQISLEGLLLTVSVIPNDLLQCTTVKHGSRSRIIQLQILIEIKKKSKTV